MSIRNILISKFLLISLMLSGCASVSIFQDKFTSSGWEFAGKNNALYASLNIESKSMYEGVSSLEFICDYSEAHLDNPLSLNVNISTKYGSVDDYYYLNVNGKSVFLKNRKNPVQRSNNWSRFNGGIKLVKSDKTLLMLELIRNQGEVLDIYLTDGVFQRKEEVSVDVPSYAGLGQFEADCNNEVETAKIEFQRKQEVIVARKKKEEKRIRAAILEKFSTANVKPHVLFPVDSTHIVENIKYGAIKAKEGVLLKPSHFDYTMAQPIDNGYLFTSKYKKQETPLLIITSQLCYEGERFGSCYNDRIVEFIKVSSYITVLGSLKQALQLKVH